MSSWSVEYRCHQLLYCGGVVSCYVCMLARERTGNSGSEYEATTAVFCKGFNRAQVL